MNQREIMKRLLDSGGSDLAQMEIGQWMSQFMLKHLGAEFTAHEMWTGTEIHTVLRDQARIWRNTLVQRTALPELEAAALRASGLQVKHPANSSETISIKEYMKLLLTTLWKEEANFNGKRPFGNSSWKHDLLPALIHAKLVDGSLEEDGCVKRADEEKFNQIMAAIIEEM
jgi:hypothetical protein